MQAVGSVVSDLNVRGVKQTEVIPIIEALSCPHITDTSHEVATPQIVRSIPSIAKYAKFSPEFCPDSEVLIPIGLDCSRAMATQCLTSDEPYVHCSPIGYSLVGKFHSQSPSYQKSVLKTAVSHSPIHVKKELRF